jgi:hypothetical protein
MLGAVGGELGYDQGQQHGQAEHADDHAQHMQDGQYAMGAHARHRECLHRRQNAGVSTTSRVNSSSRPSSMAKEHTEVWKSVRTA